MPAKAVRHRASMFPGVRKAGKLTAVTGCKKVGFAAPGGKKGYAVPSAAEDYLLKNMKWHGLQYLAFLAFAPGDAEYVMELSRVVCPMDLVVYDEDADDDGDDGCGAKRGVRRGERGGGRGVLTNTPRPTPAKPRPRAPWSRAPFRCQAAPWSAQGDERVASPRRRAPAAPQGRFSTVRASLSLSGGMLGRWDATAPLIGEHPHVSSPLAPLPENRAAARAMDRTPPARKHVESATIDSRALARRTLHFGADAYEQRIEVIEGGGRGLDGQKANTSRILLAPTSDATVLWSTVSASRWTTDVASDPLKWPVVDPVWVVAGAKERRRRAATAAVLGDADLVALVLRHVRCGPEEFVALRRVSRAFKAATERGMDLVVGAAETPPFLTKRAFAGLFGLTWQEAAGHPHTTRSHKGGHMCVFGKPAIAAAARQVGTSVRWVHRLGARAVDRPMAYPVAPRKRRFADAFEFATVGRDTIAARAWTAKLWPSFETWVNAGRPLVDA